MFPITPAFLGLFAGLWKLAIVAAVVIAVVGRSRSRFAPWLRLLKPWTEPPSSRKAVPAGAPAGTTAADRRSSRLYWSMTIVAAAAVAAWIVTSMTIRASARR